ncbi:DoxX family protein [Patescibacteria group bacterium]|nr:DoxX family protein [Patescibacteria group bacterium]
MLDSIAFRFQKFAPLLLRFGLATVFLLFGVQKLINPSQTTVEIQLLLNFELADAAALSFYMGLFEILIALAFIVGLKVRFSALVSSLLISIFFISFLVKYGFSISPDLYRDIGLLGASMALFLLGAGPWSIDSLLRKKGYESR